MLDLICTYENYLSKIKQASVNTVSSYMRDIRQYDHWLTEFEETQILDATQLNISHYLDHLKDEGRSGATISRNLASLKNFYAYLVSSGFLTATPVTDIKVERGESKLPNILSGREIELLLAQPTCVDAKGYRDKAMLEVMYATGVRVTELIDLDVDDVNLEVGIIKCASSKKSRIIPLYPGALKALSVEATLALFRELGLLTTEGEGGRMYPLSDAANSVLDVLRFAIDRENVELKAGAPVLSVQRNKKVARTLQTK